ncbi:ABC transporter permease [Leucobacter allii]|uniref:ABC transporter permease n=1 Tax=Leucobacter allii TaxID=2932247 RepID=A0ABY4FMF5_9MICO|nr:ABC transporter permease [Leucobacter allii]UOQ57453.1 ABC transporter permease [Leucobacter allii]
MSLVTAPITAPSPVPTTRQSALPLRRPRSGGLARRAGLVFAVVWLLLLTALATSVQWLPIPSYDEIVGAPFQPVFAPDAPLGTDSIGRSIFSRAIYGARASLTLGVVAAAISLVLGGLLGLVAGYYRGVMETVVDLCSEVVQAFPAMLFLVALAAAIRPSLATLTISMAVLMVPAFARMMKGAVLAQTGREFIAAARAQGAGPIRIMFREILPNTLMSIASFAIMVTATLIVIEGSVSFLGYGIPAPQPSWGGMVAESQSQLATHPAAVMIPIVFLFLTVFALNAMSDWLRARFDVGQNQI